MFWPKNVPKFQKSKNHNFTKVFRLSKTSTLLKTVQIFQKYLHALNIFSLSKIKSPHVSLVLTKCKSEFQSWVTKLIPCSSFSPARRLPPSPALIPFLLSLPRLPAHLSSFFFSCFFKGKLTDTASSSSSSRSESPQLLSPKEGVTAYTHTAPYPANPAYAVHSPAHAFR